MSDTKQYAVVDGKLQETITKQVVSINLYDYKALIDQRARIQAQRDADNAQRDAELLDMDARISAAKANSLDVTTKP